MADLVVKGAHKMVEEPPAALRLRDAVNLVVGIVVGTSIFRTTADVFQNTNSPAAAFAAWTLGGVLSLVGALCYAELATTYPRSGGDYVYLSLAFGKWAGFLFGWVQLTAVLSSSIGTMAFAMADYARQVVALPQGAEAPLAVLAVVGLSIVNSLGVSSGPRVQHVLTLAKVLGIACVLLAGAWLALAPQPTERSAAVNLRVAAHAPRVATIAPTPDPRSVTPSPASFGLALVFVLYAYGGWNDAAFVAAEVADRRRNVPRALLGGLAAITLLYLSMNAAYLAGLGVERASRTATPAADLVAALAGPSGRRFVSALVMISALGAINGMLLTGSRLYAALGADHAALGWLGRTSAHGVPRGALAAQASIVAAMILAVGTAAGRGAVDAALHAVGVAAVPWQRYLGGFETLLAATAPLFWTMLLATSTALIVLRRRNPDRQRPFSVPCYPWPPLLFAATCGFMLFHSLDYAGRLTLLALPPALLGILLYAFSKRSPPQGG